MLLDATYNLTYNSCSSTPRVYLFVEGEYFHSFIDREECKLFSLNYTHHRDFRMLLWLGLQVLGIPASPQLSVKTYNEIEK